MSGYLIKTQRILDREGSRMYVQRDEDTGAARLLVYLDDETVAELGESERITLTVQPGDHLNVEHNDFHYPDEEVPF